MSPDDRRRRVALPGARHAPPQSRDSTCRVVGKKGRVATLPLPGNRTTTMTERTIFFISILLTYFFHEASRAVRNGGDWCPNKLMQLACHKDEYNFPFYIIALQMLFSRMPDK